MKALYSSVLQNTETKLLQIDGKIGLFPFNKGKCCLDKVFLYYV